MTDQPQPKYVHAQEFRERYLQEINRLFLHPLGMALAVNVDDDGETTGLAGVIDSRDDPEGFIYGEGILDQDKADSVAAELASKAVTRHEAFGWLYQPCQEPDKEEN